MNSSVVGLPFVPETTNGGDNIMLVVNSSSADSLTIANYYAWLRQLPPANIMHIAIDSGTTAGIHAGSIATDETTFVTTVLAPTYQAIQSRNLMNQIDSIAYSADIWYQILGTAEASPSDLEYCTSNYLTYYLHSSYYMQTGGFVTDTCSTSDGKQTLFSHANSYCTNQYFRVPPLAGTIFPLYETSGTWGLPGQSSGVIPASRPYIGFRHKFRWGISVETNWGDGHLDTTYDATLLGDPGFAQKTYQGRYYLSMLLGWTGAQGNVDANGNPCYTTLDQIISYLTAAKSADATSPNGTVYFSENNDIRSTERSPAYPNAVANIQALGGNAVITGSDSTSNVNGNIPVETDIIGLSIGAAVWNWPDGAAFLPGAIADNFTSFAGIIADDNGGQTKLTSFLAHGAAASYGSIGEPFVDVHSFIYPDLHYWYRSGSTVSEALWAATLGSPNGSLTLMVGDPLCCPYKKTTSFAASLSQSDTANIAGTLNITSSGTNCTFEYYLDGVLLSPSQPSLVQIQNPGNSGMWTDTTVHFLDTTAFPDGYHVLGVVAVNTSSDYARNRKLIPLTFNNNGLSLTVALSSNTPTSSDTLTITITSNLGGATYLAYHGMRTVGSVVSNVITIGPGVLGSGPATLQVVGTSGGTQVISAPIQLNIDGSAQFTFTGPGGGNEGIASSTFTITPTQAYTGVMVLSTSVQGDFVPSILQWNNSAAAKTFTYTPNHASSHIITANSFPPLASPASLDYEVTPATAFGLATVSGVTAATALSPATCAGVAAVNGTTAAVKTSAGTCTGGGVTSGVGHALDRVPGTCTGGGVTSGVGHALDRVPGSCAAVAVVSGVGAALFRVPGSCAGIAALSGFGAALGRIPGSCVGVAAVSGIGAALGRVPGSCAGIATLNGVGVAAVFTIGSCAGASVVSSISGIGSSIGTIGGVATISGVTAAIKLAAGSCDGIAVVTGHGSEISPQLAVDLITTDESQTFLCLGHGAARRTGMIYTRNGFVPANTVCSYNLDYTSARNRYSPGT